MCIEILNLRILCCAANATLVLQLEPRRQFEIAFKMMDVDGSNFIDKAEFLQVL